MIPHYTALSEDLCQELDSRSTELHKAACGQGVDSEFGFPGVPILDGP